MEPAQSTSPAISYQNRFDSPLSNARHFTLGDKLLTKQLQLDIMPDLYSQPPCQSPRSPYGTSALSPTLILADATNTPNAADVPDSADTFKSTSWLPCPRPLSYCRSPLNTRGSKLQGPVVHEIPHTIPSSPSVNVAENATRPTTMKLFGQFVQLESVNNFKFHEQT